MKVTIGKVFYNECLNRGMTKIHDTYKDETEKSICETLARAKESKRFWSVDVNLTELNILISECDWFVYMNNEDKTSDYYNLKNQLKSFEKAKSKLVEENK